MCKFNKIIYVCLLTVISIGLFSCVSPKIVEKGKCSREILGKPVKTEKQLAAFFMYHNPDISRSKVEKMTGYYVSEARAEGINSDVAFVQMCLETGFLRYGNLVTPDMNNFCGLGSTGPGNPGCSFETPELGVRAHIQHLQAYATDVTVQLKKELVDPRYSWVHKAKHASTVFDLAGQWAADPQYGIKLDKYLSELETMF